MLLVNRYSFNFISDLDIVHHTHTAGDETKICILTIQPRSIGFGNKNWRIVESLGIAPGWDPKRACDKRFLIWFGNHLSTACAIAFWISTLDYPIFNAVES